MTLVPTFRDDNDMLPRHLVVAGCLALILGAKLWLIAEYGSSTPFWDQWSDAEHVLRPYLTGTLGLSDLFAHHNEHRILFTRLSALGLFVSGGRWDPVMQTIFNAVLHTAALAILLVSLSRRLNLAGTFLLAVYTALLFAVPFGWENTLIGYQNQFYYLLLLGSLSLWVLSGARAWTARWWIGTLLGVGSYFTIASGALTLPAFVILAAVQIAIGRRAGRAEWLALLLHIVLAVAIAWDVSTLAAQAELAPKSVIGWIEAFSLVGSWPIAKTSWPIALRVTTMFVIYAPTLILAYRLLKQRPAADDAGWFRLALAIWAALQTIALAYGREGLMQSRYYDILLIGALINGANLFHLVFGDFRNRRGPAIAVAAAIWLMALTIGAGQKAFDSIPSELAWRHDTAALQTQNLSRFLATGDFSALANKPRFHIPVPAMYAEHLRDLVTDPIIRSILPPTLLGRSDQNRSTAAVLRNGKFLMPIGLGLLMIAGMIASMASGAANPDRTPDIE